MKKPAWEEEIKYPYLLYKRANLVSLFEMVCYAQLRRKYE